MYPLSPYSGVVGHTIVRACTMYHVPRGGRRRATRDAAAVDMGQADARESPHGTARVRNVTQAVPPAPGIRRGTVRVRPGMFRGGPQPCRPCAAVRARGMRRATWELLGRGDAECGRMWSIVVECVRMWAKRGRGVSSCEGRVRAG